MPRVLNPQTLSRPLGFSHGVAARGETLFVAGQIGSDPSGRIPSDDLVEQFSRALANALVVVKSSGGAPGDVARMTLYVTDKNAYKARSREIGAAYRAQMGRHYPAMSLVEVKSLFEDAAQVEIELTAVLPGKKVPRTRPSVPGAMRRLVRQGTALRIPGRRAS
jgi:enamine deaminase RidA (YjgF/YER057c/UK114 family)